jgi:hypothetical protein
VFFLRDGHVLTLQPFYDSSYTSLQRSLHHFTLQISDKMNKVSTLRLKLCSSPTALLAQPRPRGRPPIVHFRDLSPPVIMSACRVHFSPPRKEEPRWELFLPGHLPGGFAHPAAVLAPTVTRPAHNHWAPNRLDLQTSGLKSGGSLVEAAGVALMDPFSPFSSSSLPRICPIYAHTYVNSCWK